MYILCYCYLKFLLSPAVAAFSHEIPILDQADVLTPVVTMVAMHVA